MRTTSDYGTTLYLSINVAEVIHSRPKITTITSAVNSFSFITVTENNA